MDEVELRKEVFAWFGASVYAANLFEQELITLLILARRLKEDNLTYNQIECFDINLSKKTLGGLIKELSKYFQLHTEFEDLLKNYLNKRNHLVHNFFRDNSNNLISEYGCKEMLNELKEMYRRFIEADQISQEMSKKLREKMGWSEDMIDEIVKKSLDKKRDK
ncbi:MAG: hypothetical protein AB1546_16730 [bacterium]